jgi:hypothetical protein
LPAEIHLGQCHVRIQRLAQKELCTNKLGVHFSISIAVYRKLDILCVVMLTQSSSFKPLLRITTFRFNATISISKAVTMKLLLLAALLTTLMVRQYYIWLVA